MKTLFTLSLCFFISVSNADFLSAQKNYQNGNYEQAFKEYLTLAKYGNNKAQYNLAVMLVKGQGVDVDLVEAYAWSKVSESNPEYKALTNTIEKDLLDEQIPQADKLYEKYFAQYSINNSKVILGPIIEREYDLENEKDSQSNKRTQSPERVEVVIEKTFAPNYPAEMAKKRIQGWVDLTMTVYPDGSARDIYVTEEVPLNSFAVEAIKAVERYRFSFKQNGKKIQVAEPRFATQRIEFKLNRNDTGINDKQQQYLDNLIEKAEEGDIEAQYTYAFLYDTFLHKKGEIEGEKINQWLFNASIDGITGAQYRLGKNIYYGNDCKIEKQKGLDWIMQAAQIGNANAQYMAYVLLKNQTVLNQTDSPPFFWLSQSAENGLNIAQLNYAKEIALLDSPTKQQIHTAKKFLSDYSKTIYKTAQWYQINAMLLYKNNDPSKALSSVKKAIKSAKKIGWDLTELEHLKTTIMKSK